MIRSRWRKPGRSDWANAEALSNGEQFVPHGENTRLTAYGQRAEGYHLHLITNGFEKTQHNKLIYSGLRSFFKEVITSEGSGSLKPNKEIFEFALLKCSAKADASIMIGDSIEVDILGAMNAGIDQVFVNHLAINPAVKPTYIVSSLKELERIFWTRWLSGLERFTR